jgi:hypothetical protein
MNPIEKERKAPRYNISLSPTIYVEYAVIRNPRPVVKEIATPPKEYNNFSEKSSIFVWYVDGIGFSWLEFNFLRSFSKKII